MFGSPHTKISVSSNRAKMQWSLFLLILMGQCSFFTCQLYEYHFIEDNKTWDKAQEYCRKNYTDLATVSNMADMKRLCDCAENQKEAWIGLSNQTSTNRTWYWSLPGVEFNESETNWNCKEPNDKESIENCGFINKNLFWGDLPCTLKKHFLCYDEANSANKFHLIEEEKCWPEAQSYCREHHTDLVSGLDQLKDKELTMKISQSEKEPWIFGLFRDTWRWSDGSNSSFRHWDHSFNEQPGEICAMLDKGKWKTDKCDDEKFFFCYDDKVILIKESKTWTEALDYCRENHNDLVSITNPHQQRWVQQRAKNASTPFVWLGLRYTCTLDFWFWVSDEAVSYENWASGVKTDDCDLSGAMDTEGQHQWVKHPDNEKFNFICSKC